MIAPLCISALLPIIKWLPLTDMVNGYDIVYKWFDHLKQPVAIKIKHVS